MSYFKNKPMRDGVTYLIVIMVALAYAAVSAVAPFLVPACSDRVTKLYPNPEFDYKNCLDDRFKVLLFMSLRECEQLRQLMFSVLMGALIGYERRSPDRAAGIRTMSVTSLGSCAFTIASMYAFRGGPMAWDASRVSAAIPSGVGFLGSGLIWKGMVGEGADALHQVHGLTTAASVWLSAAVGVLAGGSMFLVAFFSVVCAMIVLRFGPRHSDGDGEDHDGEDIHHEDVDRCTESATLDPSNAPDHRNEIHIENGEEPNLYSHLLIHSSSLNSERHVGSAKERKKTKQSVLQSHF